MHLVSFIIRINRNGGDKDCSVIIRDDVYILLFTDTSTLVDESEIDQYRFGEP